jgi:hypothetical protein
MPSDIIPFIDSATEIIGIVIYLFAIFRAITIGRALVNRVYRDRAYFVGALIVFVIAQSFVPDNWVFFGFYAYQVTYFALLFFILVLIDNTVLVGLDMDFFHRNTLRWRQTRFVAYLIFIVDVVLLLIALNGYLPASPRGGLLVLGSFVVVFIYAAATLVVTALRTPDRPIRRFLMFAGLLIAGFLVSTLINNYTYIDSVDVFDDLLGIGLAYVNYLMVMSLSPMSKIKKESDQAVS